MNTLLRIEGEGKKPHTYKQDLNPWPLGYEASDLPLCKTLIFLYSSNLIITTICCLNGCRVTKRCVFDPSLLGRFDVA